MDNIFTLMKRNVLPSTSKVLTVLENATNPLFFESDELYQTLDKNLKPTPNNLVKKIKAFRQTTTNLNLFLPQMREVNLN